MKRLIWVALCALALSACDNKAKFTIEGTIEGAEDSLLYFEHLSLSGIKTLDSVKLDKEGTFIFRADTTSSPEFYVLRIHDQIVNIAVDSTETITVKGHYPNLAARYEVEGSENCQKIRSLALMQQELQRKAIALDGNRSMAPSVAQDSLLRLVEAYKQTVINDYVYQAPNQSYAYFALFQTLGRFLIFDPENNVADMRAFMAVATSWDTFYPGTERTQNLHNIVMRQIDAKNAQIEMKNRAAQADIEIETGLINIVLADNHGISRELRALKGKVVLLDFHTFQMKESAARILMLRELYNKFHEQGFEIYQVALDGDEHFWKQKTQHLPWVSVRDADGHSAVSYNVTEIPEYFLIDRDGQLQKRSTQIKDLEAEIKSML